MVKQTVGTVVAAYLKFLERQNAAQRFSADHLENVRRDLASFSAFVGASRSVSSCKQHDLTAWLDSNAAKWKSVYTQRNAVASVIGCFAYAEEEERIDRCPFKRPRSLRNVVSAPRRPATVAEYLALLRDGSRPLRHALFFLWHTGARTCEMRELTWPEVILDSTPRIVLTHHKTAGQTGRARIIALNPVVAKFLKWMKARAKGTRVFVNNDGTPWDRHTFARHLRRTAKRIGLDCGDAHDRVSAYCLRHSFACAAIVAGLTSKQVADQLGHADSKMVEKVYASHTSKDVAYLSAVAVEINRRRA